MGRRSVGCLASVNRCHYTTLVPKRVAIVQSSYIPWKGYFDMIRRVDEFILLDDVQYTRRDWRNRNRVKTPEGTTWLTIPVQVKGRYHQKICDTKISDPTWNVRHLSTFQTLYTGATSFDRYAGWLEDLYLGSTSELLSEINYRFLVATCEVLRIDTRISWSMDYEAPKERGERILGLCRAAGAEVYLSGPAAASYLDEESFAREGMRLEWMDYSRYPEYGQLYPPFEHSVTILDLILNEGPEATSYLDPS